MQGLKELLIEKGMTLPKVSILVGGPDWPTSVLAGILDCSLLQCLIGTIPCVFQASCAVISGAMLSRTGIPYDSMAGIFSVATIVINMSFTMLASF